MKNNILFPGFSIGIFLISGCVVAPPTTIYTSSYIGKDFKIDKKNDHVNLVMLLPSNAAGVEGLSNYRGVYGSFAKNAKSWHSPFSKLNISADWDNNAGKYSVPGNVLASIKIVRYDSNPAKDSVRCVMVETAISTYPFSDYSKFLYKGENCSGGADVRIMVQPYLDGFNRAWESETYASYMVNFTSVSSVDYDDSVDKLLGFLPKSK